MSYTEHVAPKRKHAESEQAHPSQIKNDAGGFTFAADAQTKLERFLILGNEKGSYYASERSMTKKNYSNITDLLKVDGKKVVDTIVTISEEGRAPKNTPAIFALAVCSVFGTEDVKAYANKAMPKVCRFSTDLYAWVKIVDDLKAGRRGKGLLRAISRWYTDKGLKQLAYQVCKYPNRIVDGKKWGHRDLLRIARVKPSEEKMSLVFRYAIHGVANESDYKDKVEFDAKYSGDAVDAPKGIGITQSQFDDLKNDEFLSYIWAHEEAKKAKTSKRVVELIKSNNITRESIPPELFNNQVWKALLPGMPLTALLRNLGQMTSKDILKPLSKEIAVVTEKLTNDETLAKARIHPMNVYMAWKMYNQGHGLRGKLYWTPVAQICDALEEAFYKSFKYADKIDGNVLVGVDVSPSMWNFSCVGSEFVSAAEAAIVMSMVVMRQSNNYDMMAFTHQMTKMKLTAKMNFDAVNSEMRLMSRNWGGTDCALPIKYAYDNQLIVDTFVILTDNQSWYGTSHVFEALRDYRKRFNSTARLAVMSFSSNEFSLADPDDSGMMDIGGLDSAVPKILNDFANGKI